MVLGGVTADGEPVVVPAVVGGIPPSEPPAPDRPRAAYLPAVGLGGAATTQVLKRYATDAVAVMFDCINQLRDDAEQARLLASQDPKALAIAAMATKSAGSLAKDVVAFTIGHRIDLNVNIRSQEDVPRWEHLPVEVRARIEQDLGALTDQAWEAPAGE